MTKDTKQQALSERIIIPMTKTMVDDVTDYWHQKRLQSRSEAVRNLIEIGLATRKKVADSK